jgi:threonylcarbamoyladenosine tRNA methylthiotransferase CDKAL1
MGSLKRLNQVPIRTGNSVMLDKTVCVIANGCPENRIDTARIVELLRRNGWSVIGNYREASFILFNACGYTQGTEELSIEIIQHINTTKDPFTKFIAYGCLSKINPERLRAVYQGVTCGSDEIESLSQMMETNMSPHQIHANYLIPCTQSPRVDSWCGPNFSALMSPRAITEFLASRYMQRFREAINVFRPRTYCIKVSTGCLNACSYCAIRFSRGKVNSKAIEKVQEEFEEGLGRGYREFGLIGTDLGAYGRDQGANLVNLLRALTERKGDYTIRLRNIQPRFLIEMMPELREIFHSGKISYLSSAAESGNNRILKAMHRGYKAEEFKEAIGMLNREFPEIQIRTQLLVGFPGETEEEFQDTLRLLDQVRFDYVEIYVFDPRPNTEAATMRDQIPRQVAKRRGQRVLMKSLFSERGRRKKALKDYRAFSRAGDRG